MNRLEQIKERCRRNHIESFIKEMGGKIPATENKRVSLTVNNEGKLCTQN